MSPTQLSAGAKLATAPRTVPAANVDDVMREQLDWLLIDHAEKACLAWCACNTCQRYRAVRVSLLANFKEPLSYEKANAVQERQPEGRSSGEDAGQKERKVE